MKVLSVFLQIVAFPAAIFVVSFLLHRLVSKKGTVLHTLTAAIDFSVAGYLIGGLALFPLYFLFQPVKIDGITYLLGPNLWAYWLVSFIVVTPLVIGWCSYFFYFKEVAYRNIYLNAIFIGLFQVPLGWIMEIIIYVYWRKTIPTIYDYFFGKNFPWIMINWVIGAIVPLAVAYLLKKRKIGKHPRKIRT